MEAQHHRVLLLQILGDNTDLEGQLLVVEEALVLVPGNVEAAVDVAVVLACEARRVVGGVVAVLLDTYEAAVPADVAAEVHKAILEEVVHGVNEAVVLPVVVVAAAVVDPDKVLTNGRYR